MLIALVPILMLVAGLVIVATTAKPPWHEFGRWLGLGGAIGIAVAYATHMVKIG
jgi:hypothetical protein